MKTTKKTVKEVKEIQEIDLPEAIKKWKQQYGRVYQSIVADEKIIWRTITRTEYKDIINRKFDDNEDIAYYQRQEALAELVILYPTSKEKIVEDFAGVADYISTECMTKSGFGLNNTEAL